MIARPDRYETTVGQRQQHHKTGNAEQDIPPARPDQREIIGKAAACQFDRQPDHGKLGRHRHNRHQRNRHAVRGDHFELGY